MWWWYIFCKVSRKLALNQRATQFGGRPEEEEIAQENTQGERKRGRANADRPAL